MEVLEVYECILINSIRGHPFLNIMKNTLPVCWRIAGQTNLRWRMSFMFYLFGKVHWRVSKQYSHAGLRWKAYLYIRLFIHLSGCVYSPQLTTSILLIHPCTKHYLNNGSTSPAQWVWVCDLRNIMMAAISNSAVVYDY